MNVKRAVAWVSGRSWETNEESEMFGKNIKNNHSNFHGRSDTYEKKNRLEIQFQNRKISLQVFVIPEVKIHLQDRKTTQNTKGSNNNQSVK